MVVRICVSMALEDCRSHGEPVILALRKVSRLGIIAVGPSMCLQNSIQRQCSEFRACPELVCVNLAQAASPQLPNFVIWEEQERMLRPA